MLSLVGCSGGGAPPVMEACLVMEAGKVWSTSSLLCWIPFLLGERVCVCRAAPVHLLSKAPISVYCEAAPSSTC